MVHKTIPEKLNYFLSFLGGHKYQSLFFRKINKSLMGYFKKTSYRTAENSNKVFETVSVMVVILAIKISFISV